MDSAMRPPLLEALRAAASELPQEVLEELCAGIEGLPAEATLGQRRGLAAGLAGAHARQVALDLLARWDTAGGSVGPQAFAWALRAAGAMDAWHRARQRIELVWTGPTPQGSTLRRIDQGLLEVLRRAQRSLVVVTFAAWEMPLVQQALQAVIERGVRTIFVMETRAESGGRLRGDARDALGAELLRRAEVYVWPLEQRPRENDGRWGSLHAKCALADDHVLLVSSANLTGHAMNLNMELGLLVEGGEMPARVGAHLRGLITEGVLRMPLGV
jgi:phosphatidylserine/phosphatidylglycerophosphate/cardiolipin synthase-like enzyme